MKGPNGQRVEAAAWPTERIIASLQRARSEDATFGSGAILGSMCTAPHEVAATAYELFLETNLGDPGHFPGTARLERELLQDLESMVHGPPGGARYLTGGTEANILACHLAREATGRDRIVVPESAHFSFDKAARLLRMDVERVPTVAHRADPEAMAAAADGAALLVGVAGTTELGLVDPIQDLATIATDAGIPMHVDAAFGGYVLPFIDGPPFDLSVPGVTSIGVDPHKMGMAPIPGGALIISDADRWDDIAVETGYVSTDTQSTLMGTRPGAAVAAAWAVHRALGSDGYRANAARCLATARRLADGIQRAGYTLVSEPELNVVTFHADDPPALATRLAGDGFRLNVVPRLSALRIVVNPHVTDDVADRFLSIL